jgi:hypothetical protein
MRAIRRTSWTGLVAASVGLLLVPVYAAAQAPPPPVTDEHDFTHCSVVGVLTGVSIANAKSSSTFGGMVGWPVTGRWGLEASAAWSDRPDDGSAFGAGLSIRRNLRAGESVMPYVKAGAGIYIATIDSSRGTPPEFYRHRFGRNGVGIDESRRTFSDPALVLGGGVSWLVTRRFAIRPEVETLIVRGGSRTTAVTSIIARLEYHFEEPRITR